MRRLLAGAVLVAGTLAPLAAAPKAGGAVPPATVPTLTITTVVSGLDHPWDVAFAPDGTMFFTERPGRLSVRRIDGTVQRLTADLSDLWVSGETGLMSVETDPDFPSNRRIYTCQGKLPNTVQVVAWTVDAGYTTATRVNNPLVGGILGTSGRHGGCSLRVDASGFLRIGTGDAASGPNPQDLHGLNGKTLRVDRFTGAGLAGNPFFGNSPAGDPRIYTWGHRNVQGLALQTTTGQMWSVEQGSDRDDEVNRLVAGGNYGWDPEPLGNTNPSVYDESFPMTNFARFPGAIGAAWSSGFPTIATSAGTFLRGDGWGTWQGALAVTTLKDSSLRVLTFDGSGRLTASATPAALNKTIGRIRGAEMGPGDILFLTTDNGSTDRILAVTPSLADGPSVASSRPGRIDLAVRAYDSQILVRSNTGGAWSAYTSIGGLTTADPDLTSWGDGRLDVVVRGLDGAVWHKSAQDGTWGSWETLGGIGTTGPAIASWAPNRLDVFVRGADGALWHRMWTGTWQPWESLGGLLASDPDVTAWGPNRLDVFARGLDDQLWHRAWIGTEWSPWQPLGGLMSSGPGVASTAANRLDVVVRGTDGRPWTMRWLGDRWTSWAPSATQATSSIDLSVRGTTVDAVTRGVDGGVYVATVNNGVSSAWVKIG